MLKSAGRHKVRISICLTAKADGTKLKPLVIFGGAKRECKELNTEFRNKLGLLGGACGAALTRRRTQ